MKSQNNIPTSKVQRATKFVTTGIKIGGNYVKHYTKKALGQNPSKEELHEDNARDIYASLSQLKGSALKVAQMLSMDKNLLPKAYVDKFTMAQYSAPPLSGPLVVKTFKKYFGKSPQELFDTFEMEAVNAASIGQVHLAYKNGKKLAVKIQYPGVADSISADLKMVKPFASIILGLPDKDIEKYLQEVELKLKEETDYELELKRSIDISQACAHIPHLVFTKYYAELSSQKILTMDWLDGKHLKEFLATNPSQEVRNQIGQALWDFYDFQMHTLKAVHADPHPGNFLLREDGTLGIIDFGCVKEIPEEFYQDFFIVINPYFLDNEELIKKVFYQNEYLHASDAPEQAEFFTELFKVMIRLLCRPFQTETFDFSDDDYFTEIYQFGDSLAKMPEILNSKEARGSRHSLYINRTYFGLYSILNELRANHIITRRPEWLRKPLAELAF
ncbi:MAG: AarF/ABC1/UbiB kinase family protein [Microscillaceae bacterium]|jgi:predicted unusual protein kinase regulating ubiquinone biosynthesis (AarF/ABC1/UbiB family)|nr:AarF/ABC1/UbiB kinase family protein [Microscillaceae bacterium]